MLGASQLPSVHDLGIVAIFTLAVILAGVYAFRKMKI